MRHSLRRALFASVAMAGALTPIAAQADTNVQPCSSGKSDCSSGTAVLHAESRAPVVSSISTDWWPKCDVPDANGHCGGDQPVQVQVSIDLAALPAPSTEPLWSVDMPAGAVVDVKWPTTKAFELSAPTSATKDGAFKVTHTLVPQIRLYVGFLNLGLQWTYSTQKYLEQYAANYKYKATNTLDFAPWAMPEAAVNVVPAPPATDTSLVSTKLINDGKNDVDVALSARTSPKFSYRTTGITLANKATITADAATGTIPMEDANYIEFRADVVGQIDVEGDLYAAPYVKVNKINNIPLPLVLDLAAVANVKYPYKSVPPVAVKFDAVTVHVPLPNVKVPSKKLDLGTVTIGDSADKTVTIKNTGELGATLAFESSDKQFKVTKTATAGAEGEYQLKVSFEPTDEGAQSATITVTSNDPDSPSQSFEVQAIGTAEDVDSPDTQSGEGEAIAGSDSGCGCRTTGARSSTIGGFAALSGMVGLLAARRRRR